MNKRIAKKKDLKGFIAFLNDVNIDEDYKNEAESIAIDNWCAWCKKNSFNHELTEDDECKINFMAWQEYKKLMNNWNENIRFINLGKRKVQIFINDFENARAHGWTLDWIRYGEGDKSSVFNQLSFEEQKLIFFHKHFHNY